MKIIKLIIISFFFISCNDNEKKLEFDYVTPNEYYNHNYQYTENFKALISTFRLYDNDTIRKIILVKEPIKFEDIGNFLNDSTDFTPFEIKYVKNQSTFLSRINFSEDLSKKIVIISNDTIRSIFRYRENSWNNFHRSYGDYFLQLSNPIFLRDYSYCILYLNYSCGGLCGEEQIRLYKKIKGIWVWTKTGYGWIS